MTRFKIDEKEPFSIHLKVKRTDTPVVERKKEKKWGQFNIFNVMAKSMISFQSIRQYGRFIWEMTFSERMEANKVLDSPILQNEGITAYIPRYMVIKQGVIKDVLEDIEIENLIQQLNSDNHNKHPIPFQIIDAVRLKSQRDERRNQGRKMGMEIVEDSMFDV
jgi:hypothetical protein